MAGRHGHKSAVAVQDGPAGPRHRSPEGSSTTVADLVPEPRGATPPTSPPVAPERRRRWPWVVLGLLLLAAIGATVFGGGADPARPGETVPAAAAPAPAVAPAPSAPAGTVTLPRLGGRNAATAVAELRRLGLTDVRMVTDDDRTVDDPGKWTAVGLQPKPGTAVPTGRPVVVTVSQKR